MSEVLLAAFQAAPLIDAYDVFQHLMDYWAETTQDDAYLIAADGRVKGAQPREIVKVNNNKLIWPQPHDYLQGRRRFKSDLIAKPVIVARYFAKEQTALETTQAELGAVIAKLSELKEERSGDDAVFAGFDSTTPAAVKDRVREIDKDPDGAGELALLKQWLGLSDSVAALKKQVRFGAAPWQRLQPQQSGAHAAVVAALPNKSEAFSPIELVPLCRVAQAR